MEISLHSHPDSIESQYDCETCEHWAWEGQKTQNLLDTHSNTDLVKQTKKNLIQNKSYIISV